MKRDESQNVEYKESWHDKYLEWICGYAEVLRGQALQRWGQTLQKNDCRAEGV